MGIIAWIVLGLIAGAIAKFLMPGRDPGGIFITIIIGIVGAVIGGFIGSSLGVGDVTGVNLWSIVLAVVGSIVLLIVYRMVTGRRAGPEPSGALTRAPSGHLVTGARNRGGWRSCGLLWVSSRRCCSWPSTARPRRRRAPGPRSARRCSRAASSRTAPA